MPQRDEHTADAYVDLAIAYLDMGRPDDAKRTISEGLEQYPADTRLLKLRSEVEGNDGPP